MEDRLLGEAVQCYISDDDESEKPELTQTQPLDQSKPPPRAQTGVKGVIEDYNEFKKFGDNYRGEQRNGKCSKNVYSAEIDRSDSDLDFSDEDEIFSQYRENKMKEFTTKSIPKYCDTNERQHVQDLSLETYEEASNSEGTVITCLYSKSADSSKMILEHLDKIARSVPHVKFCRADRDDVLNGRTNSLLEDGLPCIIGNFNGKQFGAIVWPDMKNELGEEFDSELLLNLLKERNYF